ncbi:MAG TPA: metalloregulator ArsR/SmtB family transcription factor [Chitinophagaceae bacterium]|nr:metalloregulator ArsR/SmtB family transcription factor [Chitinophagaceae bacterium]
MRRDVFQAIADPTRREIINLLSQQRLNLNAVSENFPISRPAISKHIKILTECGLLIIRQEGRERYCEPQLHKLKEVAQWTEQYNKFWAMKLGALKKFLENKPAKTKSKKLLLSKSKGKI